MPTKTRNGVTVPVNSDAYNIPQDLKNAFESANLTIPVVNVAERNALAAKFPNNTLPVGTQVARLDLPGLIETWAGTRWFSNSGAIHLELARVANTNQADTLWGPGTPTEMQSAVDSANSRNPSQFSFPGNNLIRVGIEGTYSISWSIINFFTTATGYINIRRHSTNQILATGGFTAAFDTSANRSSISVPANTDFRFNFVTDKAVAVQHLISITKTG